MDEGESWPHYKLISAVEGAVRHTQQSTTDKSVVLCSVQSLTRFRVLTDPCCYMSRTRLLCQSTQRMTVNAKMMCSLPLVHANLLLTTSSKNEPGVFQMSATQGEPAGYMSAKQVAGGMVHLISSRNHYGFVSPHALCRCLWLGSFLTAVVIAEPRVATQAAGCMTVMCVA